MSVAIKLDTMTTAEKIRVMEFLWDDLCRQADKVPSPSWHKDILQDRERTLSAGQDDFIDWESAKKRMRDTVA